MDFEDIMRDQGILGNDDRALRAQNLDLRRRLGEMEADRLQQQNRQDQLQQQLLAAAAAPRQENQDRDGLSIPMFYGNIGDNFIEWLSFYDTIGNIKQWDDARKLLNLPAKLRENAWRIFQALPATQRDTYEHLKAALTDKFMGGHHRRANALNFAKKRQIPGEAAEQFAMSLQTAFQMAYPDRNPADFDSELQLRFEEGALDGDRITEMGPTSFSDAVAKAINLEAGKKRRNEKMSEMMTTAVHAVAPPVSRSEMNAITQKLTELSLQISSQKTTPAGPNAAQLVAEVLKVVDGKNQAGAVAGNWNSGQQGRNGNFEGLPKCFKCGKSGHNQFNCRTKFCENHKSFSHSTEECSLNRQSQRQNRPYCNIHQSSTHSTEECSLNNRRNPQPSREYCEHHRFFGHSTADCRMRPGQHQGNQDARGAPQPPNQYQYHRNGVGHVYQQETENTDLDQFLAGRSERDLYETLEPGVAQGKNRILAVMCSPVCKGETILDMEDVVHGISPAEKVEFEKTAETTNVSPERRGRVTKRKRIETPTKETKNSSNRIYSTRSPCHQLHSPGRDEKENSRRQPARRVQKKNRGKPSVERGDALKHLPAAAWSLLMQFLGCIGYNPLASAVSVIEVRLRNEINRLKAQIDELVRQLKELRSRLAHALAKLLTAENAQKESEQKAETAELKAEKAERRARKAERKVQETQEAAEKADARATEAEERADQAGTECAGLQLTVSQRDERISDLEKQLEEKANSESNRKAEEERAKSAGRNRTEGGAIKLRRPWKTPTSIFTLACLMVLMTRTVGASPAPIPATQTNLMTSVPAMTCQTSSGKQIFRLPNALPCYHEKFRSKAKPETARVSLYRRNHIQYKSRAFACKVSELEIRSLTYFFNDERQREKSQRTIPISSEECARVQKFKTSKYGDLISRGNIWKTVNEPDWTYPGGGVHCCYWKIATSTNIFIYEASVYKRHDSDIMESTAGVVSHCSYAEGSCALKNGEALVWTPDVKESCEFLDWKEVEGERLGDSWIAEDGNLALTHHNHEETVDCNGNALIMSQQGIPFRYVAGSRARRYVTRSKPNTYIRKLHRASPRAYHDGLVTTDVLAASLQAVEAGLQKNLQFAFSRAMSATCRAMTTTIRILRADILANPTLTMRALLGTQFLIARSSLNAIETWPCAPLSEEAVTFLPMNGSCTNEIPIEFVINQQKYSGFLDPKTNIVHKSGFPADCALNHEIPLTYLRKNWLYQSRTGELKEADHLSELQLLQWNMTSFIPLETTIFHQTVIFNWTELQTHISLNDMLSTMSSQRQLLTELGVRSHDNPTSAARQLLANIGARSYFGFLTGLNFDPWQIWTFACCLTVTITALMWCCCPSCLQKMHRDPAMTIVQFYQGLAGRKLVPTEEEVATPRITEIYDESVANELPPTYTPPPAISTDRRNALSSKEPLRMIEPAYQNANQTTVKTVLPTWELLKPRTSPDFVAAVFSAPETASRKNPTRIVSPPRISKPILRCILPLTGFFMISLLLWTQLNLLVSLAWKMKDSEGITNAKVCFRRATFRISKMLATLTEIPKIAGDFTGHLYEDQERSGLASLIDGNVEGVGTRILLDTGASISIISAPFARKLRCTFEKPKTSAISMSGTNLPFIASARVTVRIKGFTIRQRVHVMEDSPQECLLGTDALEKFGQVSFNFRKGQVTFDKGDPINFDETKTDNWRVRVENHTWLPPRSETFVAASLEGGPLHKASILVEPTKELGRKKGIALSRSLHEGHNHKLRVKVLNPNAHPVHLWANQTLGTASIVYSPETVALASQQIDPVRARPSALDSLDLSDIGLDVDQQRKLQNLLENYEDCFAANDFDLGTTQTLCHKIDTGDARPFKQRMYRIPFADRPAVKKQLEDMVKHKVIQPSTSPYSSPIVCVRKKTGEIRICGDFRKLNEQTIKDTYALPRIDELLDTVGRAGYYTTMDLCSGFWQIPMDKESREKTAVTTMFGLYEYLKLPFGLTNSPATFQRLMETVLSGLTFECAACYVDDLICYTNGPFEKHLEDLAKIFDRLRKHGLKLKLKKCHWAQQKLDFLGHTISKDGIQPNDDKVEAVKNYPQPKNLTDVRAFLGLVGFYRKFIKEFAKIAYPINELLRKDRKFYWSKQCEEAANELKHRLITAPILQFPDFRKDFKLSPDACDRGLGVVLAQKGEDGRDHPIAYASRTLIKAEKSYSTPEKEALAIVFGFTHFRQYLLGHKVIVSTDHSPLRFLKTHKNPNSRLQRWSMFLSQFHIDEITHVAGKNNGHADGLSRGPLPAKDDREWEQRYLDMLPDFNSEEDNGTENLPPAQSKQDEERKKALAAVQSITANSEQTAVSAGRTEQHVEKGETRLCTNTEEIGKELACAVLPFVPPNIQKLQREDPEFKDVINYHVTQCVPEDKKEAERVFQLANDSCMRNNLLYFFPKATKCLSVVFLLRLALPVGLRPEIIASFHDSIYGGHLNFQKTFEKISTRFYWPRMSADVLEHCQNCQLCLTRKGVKLQKKAPLTSTPTGQLPFEKVAVDVVGPIHQTYEGHRFILVFTDYATKYAEAVPCQDVTAETVASAFMTEIICRHGAPLELLSDRGTNFLSALVQKVCELSATRKTNTSGYSPQTNGLVENFNKTLIGMLSNYVNKQQTDWHLFIPFCLFAHRTAIHRSTGFSPAQLLYGRDLRQPIDSCFHQPRNPHLVHDDDYIRLLQTWLTEARESALQSNELAQAKQKLQYDKKVKQVVWEKGQQVYIYTPSNKKGLSHKLLHEFHGPYVVVDIHLPRLKVQSADKQLQPPFWVHTTRVKTTHLRKLPVIQEEREDEKKRSDYSNEAGRNCSTEKADQQGLLTSKAGSEPPILHPHHTRSKKKTEEYQEEVLKKPGNNEEEPKATPTTDLRTEQTNTTDTQETFLGAEQNLSKAGSRGSKRHNLRENPKKNRNPDFVYFILAPSPVTDGGIQWCFRNTKSSDGRDPWEFASFNG